MQVMSGAQIMDEMLGDIVYPKDSSAGKLYKFQARVGVVKRRPPRHEYFDFIRDMGMVDVARVFKGESFEGKKCLTFIFPERWMGVVEEQAFTSVLNKHPEVDSIEQVDIITSSPMLVGSFHREQIRILTWPDDHEYSCGNDG